MSAGAESIPHEVDPQAVGGENARSQRPLGERADLHQDRDQGQRSFDGRPLLGAFLIPPALPVVLIMMAPGYCLCNRHSAWYLSEAQIPVVKVLAPYLMRKW